jgi:hypothetical protein
MFLIHTCLTWAILTSSMFSGTWNSPLGSITTLLAGTNAFRTYVHTRWSLLKSPSSTNLMWVCVCMHAYICMRMFACMRMHVCMHAYVCVCKYNWVHGCILIQIYVFKTHQVQNIYAHTEIWTFTLHLCIMNLSYAYTRTRIHAYMYTLTDWPCKHHGKYIYICTYVQTHISL